MSRPSMSDAEDFDPTRLSASSPHDYRRMNTTPEVCAAMIREHAPEVAAALLAEVEANVRAHEPRWWGTGYGGGRMVCVCGDACEDGYVPHLRAALSSPATDECDTFGQRLAPGARCTELTCLQHGEANRARVRAARANAGQWGEWA